MGHVFQKQRKRLNLRIVEFVFPVRHAGPANAVLDLPERPSFWIVLDAMMCKLRRRRYSPLAMGDIGAPVPATPWHMVMVAVQLDPADQIGVGQRDRIRCRRRLVAQDRAEVVPPPISPPRLAWRRRWLQSHPSSRPHRRMPCPKPD